MGLYKGIRDREFRSQFQIYFGGRHKRFARRLGKRGERRRGIKVGP